MGRLCQVDRNNFHSEASLFLFAAQECRDLFVVLDTEYPGSPYRSEKPYHLLSPDERYDILKQNVSRTHPIQVGITLCHRVTKASDTWQFNLCDFDVRFHLQVPKSIALLKASGFDFKRSRLLGVPSTWIVQLLLDSNLMGYRSTATWVTFHGNNDFAILLKAYFQLTKPSWIWKKSAELPCTLTEFMKHTRFLFGSSICDVRCLIKRYGRLSGGLERVAAHFGLRHTTGVAHQAGSNSFLTCQLFLMLQRVYFNDCIHEEDMSRLPCQGELFGFQEEPIHVY